MRTGRLTWSIPLALLIAAGALGGAPAATGQRPAAQAPATGTGLIVGEITDATSRKPIAGAIVTMNRGVAPDQLSLAQAGLVAAAASRLQAMTGADGRFAFRDLPKGGYTITAAKGGYLAGGYGRRRPNGPTQTVDLADGQRTGILTIPMWKHAVLTGTVTDEAGEPVIGIAVRAMRRNIVGRQVAFVDTGSYSTDDRGIYRIPRLIPGDYIVAVASMSTAVPASTVAEYTRLAQNNDPAATPLMRGLIEVGANAMRGGTANSIGVGEMIQTLDNGLTPPPAAPGARLAAAYPTSFYPAARSSAQATVITLGSGEERTAIDLQIKPVAVRRVSGTIIGPAGPAVSMPVHLTPAGTEAATGLETAATVTDGAGNFTFLGVPPGDYVLRVTQVPRPTFPSTTTTIIETGGGSGMMTMSSSAGPATPPPLSTDPTFWAVVPLAVGRADISGVAVALRTGVRVNGRVEFEGTKDRPSGGALERIAIQVSTGESRPSRMGIPLGRVDATGRFTTAGLPGGKYFVRPIEAPAGWTFKSAIVQGRDVSEVAMDLDASDVTGVVITFTDRPTELSGTATGPNGPDAAATVIVFPADDTAFTDSGASPRRLASARTNADGTYKITGLPPGNYYVAAVPDETAADWQDAKFLRSLAAGARQIALDDADRKVQDVRTTRPK